MGTVLVLVGIMVFVFGLAVNSGRIMAVGGAAVVGGGIMLQNGA